MPGEKEIHFSVINAKEARVSKLSEGLPSSARPSKRRRNIMMEAGLVDNNSRIGWVTKEENLPGRGLGPQGQK